VLGAQVDRQVAMRIAHAMEGPDSPTATIVQRYIDDHARASTAAMLRRWHDFRDCPRFFD
jgi:hypothetical protein